MCDSQQHLVNLIADLDRIILGIGNPDDRRTLSQYRNRLMREFYVVRCDDCGALLHLDNANDIGGEITLCGLCYDRTRRVSICPTATTDDGAYFMRDLPWELD